MTNLTEISHLSIIIYKLLKCFSLCEVFSYLFIFLIILERFSVVKVLLKQRQVDIANMLQAVAVNLLIFFESEAKEIPDDKTSTDLLQKWIKAKFEDLVFEEADDGKD